MSQIPRDAAFQNPHQAIGGIGPDALRLERVMSSYDLWLLVSLIYLFSTQINLVFANSTRIVLLMVSE